MAEASLCGKSNPIWRMLWYISNHQSNWRVKLIKQIGVSTSVNATCWMHRFAHLYAVFFTGLLSVFLLQKQMPTTDRGHEDCLFEESEEDLEMYLTDPS
jgi:hypothetical protein